MYFTKMHGTGNDYIIINLTDKSSCTDIVKKSIFQNAGKLSVKFSDRHFGIGSDGIILVCDSRTADCGMKMFNSDGSEGKMCGNGIRCLGKYVYERLKIKKNPLSVETASGIRKLYFDIEKDIVQQVKVDMGIPKVSSVISIQTQDISLVPKLYVRQVNIGNSHAVFFSNNDKYINAIEYWGPFIETHTLLKEPSNVEAVRIISEDTIQIRIWERGSRETFSCGTGACAAAVCTMLDKIKSGISTTDMTVIVPGGKLYVAWEGIEKNVFLKGNAEFVFDGYVKSVNSLL